MGDFGDKLGWILGLALLVLVFLVIGRVRGWKGEAPKWQHPADRADKPDKPDRPEGYGRKRFVQARGPNREKGGKERREHEKREGKD